MKRLISSSILLLLMFMCLPQHSSAQGTPSEGKDYYIGYIQPSYQTVVPGFSAGFFGAYVLISSFQDNKVFISYFNDDGTETSPQPYKVFRRQAIQQRLDLSKMLFKEDILTPIASDRKGYRSCHITSQKPINVQFFSTGPSSCGSYLALPTNALGKNYVVQSWNDNPEGDLAMIGGRGPASAEKSCGIFEIVAAYNGTQVSITPTSTTQVGNHTGTVFGPGANGTPIPYTISLNRGECYIVKSWCSSNETDISSSVIRSDKPVFVIAGHEDAALGAVGNRPLEGRDYMIESMIPCEYWDTTGYVAAPLIDSSPLGPDDGEPGELYRVFTCDSGGAQVSLKIDGFSGTRDANLGLYAPPPNFRAEAPVHFYSTNGKKFAVMQYDQRNQSTTGPFPAESMISIVPISRWRNAYLWYVAPNLSGEKLQGYYVNVYGPHNTKSFDSITVSLNGGQERSISTMAKVGSYISRTPDHPEIRVVKYRVSPGSYYMHANFPFMVYHYGYRAVDADGDLGDFDNDDNFFSYGLPVGMVLNAGVKADLKIEVDTNCASWHVKVTDRRLGGGIKSALLLDDPDGDLVVPPDSIFSRIRVDSVFKDAPVNKVFDSLRYVRVNIKNVKGYVYFNTSFDPKDDPAGNREINYTGNDTVVTFDILVDDVSKDGYAPLYIIDNAGNTILIELRFKRALVKYVPGDSLSFGMMRIGDDSTGVVEFINLSNSTHVYDILKAELLRKDPAFKIDSVRPALPTQIKPGETLKIYVHFTSLDLNEHLDSVLIQTDCFKNLIPLIGRGGTPLIIAGDLDFGTILVGTKKCLPTTVKNVGNMPFILDTNYFLLNYSGFTLDAATRAKLPITLDTGTSNKSFTTVTFCYSPVVQGSDSNVYLWGTNIRPPYEHSIDDISKLKGKAVKPGVQWDRDVDTMRVLCDSYDSVRVYLLNTGTTDATIIDTKFTGTDAAEFSIIGIQPGITSGYGISKGDSIWVDVKFQANLSKTPKYRNRDAVLEAFPDITGDTVSRKILFTGIVRHGEGILRSFGTDTLKMGYVTLGAANTITFFIYNTGDSTLIINKDDIPPEIVLPGLNFPISIKPGDSTFIFGRATLNNYTTDTVFVMSFISNSPCSPPIFGYVQMAAAFKDVKPRGFDAPPTYVVCRQVLDSVSLTNTGTIAITLRQIEIYDDVAPNVNSKEFQFVANNVQIYTLPTPKVIAPNKTGQIYVNFKPQVEGPLAARVRFIYDYIAAGTNTKIIDTAYEVVRGPGVLLRNTFSAKSTDGQPFHARTADNFDLPITITDNIELPAGVYGAIFTLTYRGDLFDYIKVAAGPGIDNATQQSHTFDAATGIQTDTYRVLGTTQIQNAGKLADITFRVMVSKERKSDFVVSNGAFIDASGAVLCYFDNQYIPGEFIPDYVCGDVSLIGHIENKPLTARIAPISPNPVTAGATPKLVYRIGVENTPVTIDMFDILGNKVRTIQTTTTMGAGEYSNLINTKSLAPGTYTIRLKTPASDVTTSFVLTK